MRNSLHSKRCSSFKFVHSFLKNITFPTCTLFRVDIKLTDGCGCGDGNSMEDVFFFDVVAVSDVSLKSIYINVLDIKVIYANNRNQRVLYLSHCTSFSSFDIEGSSFRISAK